MLNSLIIGFGRAGRDLHWRCLQKARALPEGRALFGGRTGVVEPCPDRLPQSQELEIFRSVEEVRGFDPANTVVHICTPPGAHRAAVAAVAGAGFKRLIVEKPLAISMAELNEITELDQRHGLSLLVVANWLSSAVTLRAKELIDSGEFGALRYLTIEQSKPRLGRTLSSRSHHSAFDVELPHQVSLALFLAGEEARVIQASCADAHHGGATVPGMGAAHIALAHSSGGLSILRSDLVCPIRKRSAEIALEGRTLLAYYPTGSDDSYGWLRSYTPGGQLIDVETVCGDPLSGCFLEYYRYFSGAGAPPRSDLDFNMQVVSVICEAKRLAEVHLFDVREGGARQDPLPLAMALDLAEPPRRPRVAQTAEPAAADQDPGLERFSARSEVA